MTSNRARFGLGKSSMPDLIVRLRDWLRGKSKVLIPLVSFLIVCCIEGCAFIATVGPLTMPDPHLHLGSTYALATLQSFNSTTMVDSPDGAKRAQNLVGDSRYIDQPTVSNQTVEGIDITALKRDPQYDAQVEALNSDDHSIVHVATRSNQYLFVSYLPQAIGMKFGLHFGLRPSAVLKLARLTNLLAFMLAIGIAIVMIPSGKWFFAVFGCLPYPVFCASSLMADGPVIGYTACFIALSLWLFARRKPLTTVWWVLLIVAAFLQCLMKSVYAPVILLVLATKALSMRRKIIYVLCAFIPATLVNLWWEKTHMLVILPDLYAANKQYVMHHLAGTIFRLVADTLVQTFDLVSKDPTTVASLLLLCAVILFSGRLNSERTGRLYGRNRLYALYALSGLAAFGDRSRLYGSHSRSRGTTCQTRSRDWSLLASRCDIYIRWCPCWRACSSMMVNSIPRSRNLP
ncbi:MAG: DUF2142 domain-containing protein [Bifidobacterium sp.]|uniref:DUF2142 domain-containing protein n=1 Tax=Bifidobacterium fermentum TaxID=3059035 RepID=A0AB39UQX6_9BIFI